MANFQDINPGLCNFCGSCAGVCPANALSIDLKNEKITFDKNRCINCGLCFKNCPGIAFDFPCARKNFRGEFNSMIGNYNALYVGQSKNDDILKNSSSGGIAASILTYLLEKRIVEGAVLITKSKSNPLGYKISVARTKDDILNRVQSLYYMVPLNVILKQLKKISLSKLAYVGLPCHVEGIRKLQMNNDAEAKKIKFIVGLFCGLNKSFKSVGFFLSKLDVNKEDVAEFSFRKGNWPGSLYVKTKDRREKWLSKDMYGFSYYMFAPQRCLVCYDFTNEFADISVGDGWSKLPSKDGWNDIVARSESGRKILLDMKKENFLRLEEKSADEIIKSHKGYFSFKKKGVFYRMNKLELHPDYGEINEYAFSDKLTFYFVKFLRLKFIRGLFSILPIQITGGLMNFMRKITGIVLFK